MLNEEINEEVQTTDTTAQDTNNVAEKVDDITVSVTSEEYSTAAEKTCCCEAEGEKSCCCEDKGEESCCCEAEGEKSCCCEDKGEESCCCEAEGEKSCCCEKEDEDADTEKKSRRADLPTIPVTDELVENARGCLQKMLELLGFEAEVRAEGGNDKINIAISSSEAGRIIGRKGKNLENIQLLLNRMIQKEDAIYPRIYIDIDGYASGSRVVPEDGEEKGGRRFTRNEHSDRRGGRCDRGERRGGRRFNDEERGGRHERGERRHSGGQDEEILRQMALDAAKEVKRWSDPKTLPPMNAHDRRIIHVTLENDADVKTYSIGEEPKSVVIALKDK